MRYPKPRRHQTRTKAVIMTGGLNDTVTNIELKEGELRQVLNYMEIDSPYHGYASIEGYEAYDGKTAPSNIQVQAVTDEGNDDDCKFLLEAPTGLVDLVVAPSVINDFGVLVNENIGKFDGGSFDFANTYFAVTPNVGKAFDWSFDSAFDAVDIPVGSLSFQGDWTLDLQIKRKPNASVSVIMEKPDVAKLTIDSNGNLTFSLASVVGGTFDYSITSLSPPIGTGVFSHVSITMRDGLLRMAINGVPIVDGIGDIIEVQVPSVYNGFSQVYFGGSATQDQYFLGYLDELRYSTISRWYHQFTPPEARYTDISYQELNWIDVAREAQRTTIEEVPGSGPCTGVHTYKGEVYALRNNISGSSAALWRAHSEPLGQGIDDSQSGWELIDDTFAPYGRMDATNWRFSGSFLDQQVMCIVDGISLPRIWDRNTDTMYIFDNAESAGIPDRAALNPRFATHVSIFDNRLVLAYKDDDIILSSKTDPRDYSEGYGDQLLIGDEITNLQELPGEAMGIFCRNSVKVLTKLQLPTSTAATPDYSFKVENFSRDAGAFSWSAERVLDKIVYADDRGIVDFATTDKFGDFSANAVSKKLNRIYLDQKLNITTSLVEKQLNQYRIFFSTGASLWFTFEDEKLKGGTYIVYPDPVLIATDGEDALGNITKYFTSEDGFIYKMDSGTSFNGAEILTSLNTSYYHYGSPRYWKQFQRVIFEMDASRGTKISFRPSFDYGSSAIPESLWWQPLLKGIGGTWGQDDWGEFSWGGAVTQELIHYIRGHGRNMSLEIMTQSKYNQRHIIHNAVVDFQLENKQE